MEVERKTNQEPKSYRAKDALFLYKESLRVHISGRVVTLRRGQVITRSEGEFWGESLPSFFEELPGAAVPTVPLSPTRSHKKKR